MNDEELEYKLDEFFMEAEQEELEAMADLYAEGNAAYLRKSELDVVTDPEKMYSFGRVPFFRDINEWFVASTVLEGAIRKYPNVLPKGVRIEDGAVYNTLGIFNWEYIFQLAQTGELVKDGETKNLTRAYIPLISIRVDITNNAGAVTVNVSVRPNYENLEDDIYTLAFNREIRIDDLYSLAQMRVEDAALRDEYSTQTPEKIQEMIRECYPDGKYDNMFAKMDDETKRKVIHIITWFRESDDDQIRDKVYNSAFNSGVPSYYAAAGTVFRHIPSPWPELRKLVDEKLLKDTGLSLEYVQDRLSTFDGPLKEGMQNKVWRRFVANGAWKNPESVLTPEDLTDIDMSDVCWREVVMAKAFMHPDNMHIWLDALVETLAPAEGSYMCSLESFHEWLESSKVYTVDSLVRGGYVQYQILSEFDPARIEYLFSLLEGIDGDDINLVIGVLRDTSSSRMLFHRYGFILVCRNRSNFSFLGLTEDRSTLYIGNIAWGDAFGCDTLHGWSLPYNDGKAKILSYLPGGFAQALWDQAGTDTYSEEFRSQVEALSPVITGRTDAEMTDAEYGFLTALLSDVSREKS